MTRYLVTFELETTIEVVNAEDFSLTEIEKALRQAMENDLRDGGYRDGYTQVSLAGDLEPTYGLRLVRKTVGSYEYVDGVHPDDPVEVAS